MVIKTEQLIMKVLIFVGKGQALMFKAVATMLSLDAFYLNSVKIRKGSWGTPCYRSSLHILTVLTS